MTDAERARAHPSWKALRPRRNFNEAAASDETANAYVARMAPRFAFPAEVLTQWMHPLYLNENAVRNYAWIDFDRVVFAREQWTTERLASLRVITSYESFVEQRSAGFATLKDFFCTPRDKRCWRDRGTWRVPPIAIDAMGLGPVPSESEIPERFQLVEGHSRVGYLRALHRIDPARLARVHDVFVLRAIAE